MNPFLPPTGSQGYQQQQQTTTSTTSSYPPYQFTQQQQQPPQNVQPYPNIYGSTTSPTLVSMNAPGVNSYGSTSNGFNNNNNNNNSNGYQSNVTAPGGISSSMGANGQPYNPFGATGVSTPSIPAGPYSFPSSSFPSSPYQPPQQQHQQPTKQLDPFANLTGLPSSSSTTTTSSSSSAWASPPTAPVGNPFDFQQSTFTSTTAPAATAGRPLNSYSSATQNQPMQTMGWSPYTPPMQQQQQQQFQQQDQYDLIAKVQNISMQQKQMRPAPSPAVPPAIGAPQTQQTNQFFQSSDPFGFQPAPSSSSATQQNPYQMSNSNAFSTTATTTTTTGYPSSNSANTNIFGSDDDAGFFSFATTTSTQTTQKAAVPPPQRAAPKAQDAYEPPTEEDQRLLRRASLLFEQGIIKSKEDKVLLQDKLLQKNKAVKEALQKAEHGDHGSACIHLLKKLKSGTAGDSDDDDDDDAAGDSDDDNKSEGTLSDDESPKKEGGSKGTSTIEEKAPHPRAGGWTGSIPATLFLEKEQFCGNILMRISSKMLFRKWKPVFVAIDVNKIAVYPSRRDWEVSGPTKAFFMIHSAMWVAKPSLKKTQSVADDGRRVFYTTVKENIGYEGRGGPPQKFSPALEHRVVVKFGSYYPNEIGSIAYAIYCKLYYYLII